MNLLDLQESLQTLCAEAPCETRNLSLDSRQTWPELAPVNSDSLVASRIRGLTGATPRQTTLLKAGLFLMHDCLDESHIESQSREGDPDADLWHAIMHRREPDYGNAKYWYRRVGQHPIFSALAQRAAPQLIAAGAAGFSSAGWDPFRFVDLCQRVERESSPLNQAARAAQWIEMSLHLAHCCEAR